MYKQSILSLNSYTIDLEIVFKIKLDVQLIRRYKIN